jgi:hypothetical protein
MDKYRVIKGIYEYADHHLRAWFARLPSNVAYIQRLNRVADVFAPLSLLALIQQEDEARKPGQAWLIDLLPAVRSETRPSV